MLYFVGQKWNKILLIKQLPEDHSCYKPNSYGPSSKQRLPGVSMSLLFIGTPRLKSPKAQKVPHAPKHVGDGWGVAVTFWEIESDFSWATMILVEETL